MIGLGVLAHQPANNYQPQLIDGIHLRWGFRRELGFPWFGFYLFRRPAQRGRPLCLSSVIGGLKKGSWPDNKYYSAIGLISSSENLELTKYFPPQNHVEFVLDGREFTRFELRPGELARRVELRIGFPSLCLEIGNLLDVPQFGMRPVPRSNPITLKDVSFEVGGPNGTADSTQFETINTTSGSLAGLGCGFGLTIKLPEPLNLVELLITRTLSPAELPANSIEAFDSNDVVVASATLESLANQPESVLLTGPSITRIEISGLRNTTYLHRICSEVPRVDSNHEDRIKVTAFSGGTPLRTVNVSYKVDQIVSVTLEADAIDAIEIGPGQAVLVDLCYVPITQDATEGWERLPEFSYPMGLPVTQSDYPCSVANPQSFLTDRVHYQLPPMWNGNSFIQLHDQLVKLVEGGPSGTPMVDRIFSAPSDPSADLNSPQLSKFYLLDMLLLGALHPSLAQLTGLCWVDQTASRNEAYDYLIVADYSGIGDLNADKVLSIIRSSGFNELEGYILFNQRMNAGLSLPAPTGLQSYELPGGTFPDAQGQLPQASNNAGLRWELNWDNTDSLLSDSAVMYLVWRADLGDGATPLSADSYTLVTKLPPNSSKPILVTEPRLPNGVVPQRSPDWPSDPLHYIDRNLPDGWYNYAVSGIDLFGRHSSNSAPTQLLLRDEIPPPLPTAVEAYPLDPEDRFIQRDQAYDNWFASLDASIRQKIFGVRVRWTWTRPNQQQAPDTKEFRLYFHPGATLPPDSDQGINWQDRCCVVGYDDNVKIDSLTGERAYEIFLPPPTETDLNFVPLNPSLSEPVVYAHIGVSAADDKLHTNDLRINGDWSNRPGNEGRVGPPAKIYRVLRTPPPPPEDVFAGERLFASPANYDSQSFFSYRWKPQPHLKLHVFRSLDDAIFQTDWAQRPLPALDPSQLDLFPAGWNLATRQAAVGELFYLNSFVGLEGGGKQAMAYYRQLSDGALRVLAGLPSSESAFVQLTINPLNPDDAANANRLGPDDPDDFVIDPAQRLYRDALDGRATNRYFYRSAFIDDAHNLGPLGLPSPPVYLPNVVPPRTPVITKVLGGDREITLKWASNREPDLAKYRVYRTESKEATRDFRLMTLVHSEAVPTGDPSSRPAEVMWVDTPLPGITNFYYRLVAVDNASNSSLPSATVSGCAFDDSRPDPPTWNPPAPMVNGIVLSWSSTVSDLRCLVQRRSAGAWENLSAWLERGVYSYEDNDRMIGMVYSYRIRVIDADGRSNHTFNELEA